MGHNGTGIIEGAQNTEQQAKPDAETQVKQTLETITNT